MSDLPIKATFKSGAGYDAPWLTIDAADPNDLTFKLDAILGGEALSKVIEVASLFKAANNVAPLTQPEAPAAPQQQPAQSGGWGQQPQQPQQQATPQVAQVQLHPEGKTCSCGRTLEYKKVTRKSDNKTFEFWSCPAQQKRGDGHDSEFAN